MLRRAVLLAILGVGLGAAPAHASCVAQQSVPESIRDADVVFVGTPIHVENNGRWAEFRVQEIWKGGLHLDVEVHGGPSGNEHTSVDRTYLDAPRYLVMGRVDKYDSSVLDDDLCSGTRVYTRALARFRPAGAPRPSLPTDGFTDEVNPPLPWPALVILGVGVALALAALAVLFRRPGRRNPHEPA